jgi:preprotein translocase subunit YajC
MLFALLLAAEGQPTEGPPWWSSLPMILPIFLLAYLLLLRPARTQDKQRQALLAGLKKNDKVVNSGGIIGIVDSVKEKDDEVVLRGGLRITRSSIVRIITPDDKEQKEAGA